MQAKELFSGALTFLYITVVLMLQRCLLALFLGPDYALKGRDSFGGGGGRCFSVKISSFCFRSTTLLLIEGKFAISCTDDYDC